MDAQLRQTVDTIVRLLQKSRSILFITGAGVSADSGVPTYRGIGGLYDVELTEEGLPIEQVLSGPMLKVNPALTWKYLAQIGAAARGATFNRAHEVIALIEEKFPRVWVLTQNIDSFHIDAGSQNVIEIHGNMRGLSCTACGACEQLGKDEPSEIPPRCKACGAMMRPDVVLFGEMLPEVALQTFTRELETGFDVVFSIGTTSVFPYIREPVAMAKRAGLPTIEINPSETEITRNVDYHLPLKAAEAMDAIWMGLTEARTGDL